MPSHRIFIKMPSILQSVSAIALAMASFAAATDAHAQQRTPGVSAECPIVAGVATCSGDLGGGITTAPGDPGFDTLIIENPIGPIAPPGYFGVGVVRDDRDITINIQDGVIINTFDDPGIGGPAQGLVAIISNGFDLTIDTGANITADGNGSFGLGIEALTIGGGDLSITNRGTINAFTSGDTAIALQGRSDSGNITINNSGSLTATSNGVGERSTVTAGILAFSNLGGNMIDVTNDGDISVTTGAASFDSDFNGVAGAIVTNVFGDASTTSIVNNGALTATGPQTSGIVGFVQNTSMAGPSGLNIENFGAITVDGVGGYGILAQSEGTNVETTVTNEGDIALTAPGGTATGIFGLMQTQQGSLNITNSGNFSGSGTNLRAIGGSTFAAPAGGSYDMLIFNDGNITFDTDLGFGITAFATLEDDMLANIVNLGNIDLSNTTGLGSIGISANFAGVDAGAMGDGTSNLTINNSGNIMMGAGNAIFAVADQVNLINTGNLSTIGDMSHVVLVEGIDGDSDLDVTIGGDAVASGADSDAINITNAGSTIVTVNNGAIVSGGTGDAVAIRLLGAQPNSAATDEITDEVTGSVGRLEQKFREYDRACLTGCTLTDIFAPIAAGNPDASAFDDVVNVDSATVESMMGAGAINSSGSLFVTGMNGAIIRSGNDGTPVISAVGALGIVASDTTFSSMGDDAPLFSVAEMAAGDGTAVYVELTDVDASTSGMNSEAFVLSGGTANSVATLFLDAGDPMVPTSISTAGNNSRAIVFDAPGSSIFAGSISNSLITTLGDNSDAVYLNVGDDGYLIAELLNTTIETSGNDSDALDLLVGDSGALDLLFGNTTFTTLGADSNGLLVSGLGDNSETTMRLINTIITTEGDRSAGISIADAGPGSTIVLNFNVVSTGAPASVITGSEIRTSGDHAPGVSIGSASVTTVSMRDIVVSTTGMGVSPAISLAGSTETDSIISINLLRSDISTVSDGSAAFEVQELGGVSSDASFGAVNGLFATEGNDSDAFVVGNISSLMANSSLVATFDNVELTTKGDNSRGIYVNARDGGDTSDLLFLLEDATITTEGNDSTGVLLDIFSAGQSNANSTVVIADSLFTTMGDNAHGVFFAPVSGSFDSASITYAFDNNQITTSGNNAHGIVLGDLPAFDSNDGSNSVLAIELLQTSTSGDDSHGLVIGQGWGSAGAISGDRDNGVTSRLNSIAVTGSVTTEGMGSHGIFSASLINNLNVEAGASITSANGDAITLEQGLGIGFENLSNEGTIEALNGAAIRADLTADFADRVINQAGGVIMGDVLLGAGSDVYIGETGSSLVGTLDMGDGDDELTLADGIITGTVQMGDGDDTLVATELVADTILLGGDGMDVLNFVTGDGQSVTVEMDNIQVGGFESYNLIGGGQRTFTGDSMVIRNMELFDGTLNIEGLLGGTNLVTVADSTLRLGGRLGSLEVGGTLSTLGDPTAQGEVTGDITFLPGSIYDVRILPTGESDIIQSGGAINIQGGMVNAMAAAGDYVAGDSFTILTGATGVNGVFDGLTDASTAFLDISLVYEDNAVLIELAADDLEDVDFTTAAGTFNQLQAAGALNAFSTEDGTDSRTVVSELSFVMAPDAEAALDATSGEVHASLLGAGTRMGRFLPDMMMARQGSVANGSASAARREDVQPAVDESALEGGGMDFGIWAAGNFVDGSVDADGNAANVSYDGYGFAAGLDWSDSSNGLILGFGMGYQKGDSNVAARASTADYESWSLGAYVGIGSGGQGFSGKLAASYAFGETDTTRQVVFGNINRTATASYDVDIFALNSELRYGFGKKASDWSFGPIATFDYVDVSRDAFQETGAGALNLLGGSDSDSLTALGGGLFANWQGKKGLFDASLTYDYSDGDFSQTRLSFEGAPNNGFSVRSPLASDSGVMARLRGEFNLGGRWHLGLGYRGRFAGNDDTHSGTVSIIWR